MKKSIKIWVLLMSLTFFAQTVNAKKFLPPETKKVSENVYMDEQIITWEAWREYMYWTENNSPPEEFQKILPDSNAVSKYYEIPKNFLSFKDVKIQKDPIIGITFEQVKDYCKWRPDRVREKFGKEVIYSIPSEEDYRLYGDFINSRRKTVKSDAKTCEYIFQQEYIFCDGTVKDFSYDSGKEISFRCKAVILE